MDDLELSLFRNKKEALIFFLGLAIIFFVNITIKFLNYQEFKAKKYHQTNAIVLKVFHKISKRGKKYHILKLQDKSGERFFAVSWQKNLENLASDEITLRVKTDKIGFYDYLKGFFAPAYGIKVIKRLTDPKTTISNFIKDQHPDKELKKFFSALFLGTSISKSLREKIQSYGISHLVAISGFHLGVLSAIFYFLLSLVYKVFQDRYFPYRNIKIDLSVAVFFLLFCYLYIVGFMPSLVRSFVMLLFGYILYIRHIKVVSFEMIVLTVVFLVSLFPELLFSISFWFSISGVFYIFLFLKYFSYLKKWQIFLLLNFWVFFMMMPIVHFVFGGFCPLQLLCIPLSVVFVLFYPFELLVHLLNMGDILDWALLKLFHTGCHMVDVKTPFWFFVSFILLSILSAYRKLFLYMLIVCDLLFFFFLLYRYAFG